MEKFLLAVCALLFSLMLCACGISDNMTQPHTEESDTVTTTESESQHSDDVFSNAQDVKTDASSEKTIVNAHILSTEYPNDLNDFVVVRTLSKKEITNLNNLSIFQNVITKNENNWVKFLPNCPNEYALAVEFTDDTSLIIAIHFTKDSGTYYIATATGGKFDKNSDYKELNYERCIASEKVGKYLCDIIFN